MFDGNTNSMKWADEATGDMSFNESSAVVYCPFMYLNKDTHPGSLHSLHPTYQLPMPYQLTLGVQLIFFFDEEKNEYVASPAFRKNATFHSGQPDESQEDILNGTT